MGRNLEDMGENDQHTLGIWVSEAEHDQAITCLHPAPIQPFIVETGKGLEVISIKLGEKVGEAIRATIDVYIAAIKHAPAPPITKREQVDMTVLAADGKEIIKIPERGGKPK